MSSQDTKVELRSVIHTGSKRGAQSCLVLVRGLLSRPQMCLGSAVFFDPNPLKLLEHAERSIAYVLQASWENVTSINSCD